MDRAGLLRGSVLEVGPQKESACLIFPAPRFQLTTMDIDPGHDLQGDICRCPEIPDESYDVVFSTDVFEHLKEPWLAAQEIVRILRPGGTAMIFTVFAWRYHPCPVDYWRFSPEALAFLFKDLEELEKGFDTSERRMQDLLPGSEPDHMGGWLEHWNSYYIGRKP